MMGEEAHIKGEKRSAPRYDPQQSDEERESYENRILLCPNHHTEIDADEVTWTVMKLLDMKVKHELQVAQNWQFPQMLDDLKKVVQQYSSSDNKAKPVSEVIEGTRQLVVVRVDAAIEGGISTGIKVRAGQRIAFFARGLISYDSWNHFTNAEGIICNEYGIPLAFTNEAGQMAMGTWPHDGAYKTAVNELGRIGSLIGWINEYSEEKAYFVGVKRQIAVNEDGELHLAVNDARGTYADNSGEYRVEIRITDPE